MKVTAVLAAQATQFLKPRLFDNYSAFELAEAVKEKYEFRQAPSVQELSMPSPPPSNFFFGKMRRGNRSVTIESFQITYLISLATALTVNMRTSTDDADFFLADLTNWARENYSVDIAPVFPSVYRSQLEVAVDKSLSRQLAFLQALGAAISEQVKSYGFADCPNYEPTGFSMHFDATRRAESPTLAIPFSFERRIAAPFAQNKYFSQAPLKTSDHERILRLLEGML
jgi:hypothetical protein